MLAATLNGLTFTAQENGATNADITDTDTCKGCAFDSDVPSRASFRTCVDACRVARAAGLPDCDDRGPLGGNVIYVRTNKGDPRQVDLAGAVVAA